MNRVALLGVDWGSTTGRAFCIAPDGAVLDVHRADDGVFAASGNFDERLRRLLGDWLDRHPGVPILMCGMIGSDRGWLHAPYVPAPAGLGALAAALVSVPFERSAQIVPGLSFADGEHRDVMRGEETLLMGLEDRDATICLPGTHAKWADLKDGRIASFRTYMTGELHALVLGMGTLAAVVPQTKSPQAFLAGLTAGREGQALTRTLFQARARRLLGTLGAERAASFLSGMLIGVEIASELQTVNRTSPVILAARGALGDAYGAAFSQAGLAFTRIDSETLAVRGLLRIAQCAASSHIGPM